MAGVRELKHRIKAVQKTKQITRAMKMVATVRYKRAHEAYLQAKPYWQGIPELQEKVFSLPEALRHPLFERRREHTVGVVIVGSDKGLCGSFNSNVFRLALRRIADEVEAGREVALIAVGRKTHDFFKRLPYRLVGVHTFLSGTAEEARRLNAEWSQAFLAGHFDRLDIYHNGFKSVMQCLPTVTTLYPLAPHSSPWSFDTLLEPTARALVSYMVVKGPETRLHQILLESVTAEQGIRMTMMDQATTKADDLARSLTIAMNKARQAAITNELIEMTAAAEALRSMK